MPKLNPDTLRPLFPALQQEVNGRPAVFLDGPGGTQVPQAVIEAMSDYLAHNNSNSGGAFVTSQRTDAVKWEARLAMADFLNAEPREVVLGANMTTLTFHLSRALARAWRPGDEIILTRLDHDANISPWLMVAAERGIIVRWLDFRPEDCALRLDELPKLLNEKTRLVAVTHASNAVGTMVDVKQVVELAHQAGALVYVDAVHYAPHASLDVKALACDFLVTSTYKYFGPHAGVLYGKYDLLDSLTAYKVRPADDRPPGKWETGTPNFEALAGIRAAVAYLAAIGAQTGTGLSRREQLVAAYRLIQQHERELSERFLRGAAAVPGLRVYGITDVERLDERTPTFAVSLAGQPPRRVAERLGEQGIFVWDGHYYAVAVMERLGLLESGGLVRVGFVHYNTAEEVERVLSVLAAIR